MLLMINVSLSIFCMDDLSIDESEVFKVLYYYYTVSPLHTNLQCANFQRCGHASGSSKGPETVSSTSCLSEIAASPLSPIADDSSALPSPTFSPSSGQ